MQDTVRVLLVQLVRDGLLWGQPEVRGVDRDGVLRELGRELVYFLDPRGGRAYLDYREYEHR